jgi:Spy/CpxP family protein refolding chaperone
MNQLFMRSVLAGGFIMMLASNSVAQDLGRSDTFPFDKAQRAAGGAFYHKPMQWLRDLDLSEAQQDQIYMVIYEREPAMREQMKIVHRAREELDKLASAPRFDPVLGRKVAEAGAKAQVEIALLRAETMNRIRGILTPEQRAKLDQQRTRGSQ